MLILPLIITSLHSISDLRMEMGRAYSLDSETPGQSFKSTCVYVCVCVPLNKKDIITWAPSVAQLGRLMEIMMKITF